jgi:hypothetical protein
MPANERKPFLMGIHKKSLKFIVQQICPKEETVFKTLSLSYNNDAMS